MRRGLAIIGVIAVVTVAGCAEPAPSYTNDAWWVGTCMEVEGPSVAPSSLGNVPCSDPHTHVVVARTTWDVECPKDTDIDWTVPDNLKFCLAKDTELRSDAPLPS